MNPRRNWIFIVCGVAIVILLIVVAALRMPRIRVTVQKSTVLVREDTRMADAIRAGNLTEVERMIAAAPETVNSPIYFGMRPLHIAALEGKAEIVSFLLSHGADVNASVTSNDASNGATPIILAMTSEDLETIKLLVAAGADLTARDPEGRTPVEIARDSKMTVVEGYLAGIAAPHPR